MSSPGNNCTELLRRISRSDIWRSTMKTLTTAILLSLGLSAGAYAADTQPPLTRAQVQAELAQAKASGEYSFGELDYPAVQAQASHLTRAQVQAELAQAKASGEYSFGELDYPPQG